MNSDATSPEIDVSKAKRESPTFTNLQPISADLMENGLRQWEGIREDCN
jgi:hypothetical protein